MDELRRLGPERLEETPVQLLVRPVVIAPHDVRDPEVDVVDDAREVIRRRTVLTEQRDPVEPRTEWRVQNLFSAIHVYWRRLCI